MMLLILMIFGLMLVEMIPEHSSTSEGIGSNILQGMPIDRWGI